MLVVDVLFIKLISIIFFLHLPMICQAVCSGNCSRCSQTTQTCRSCWTGYYFSAPNNCVQCPASFCSTCANTTGTCIACSAGYYLTNTFTCSQCLGANCTSCATNTGTCIACSTGYYLTNTNTCSQCLGANCTSCTNLTGICNGCSIGYYLTSSNTCSPCPANCYSCSSGTGKCNSCNTGYYLNMKNFTCQTNCDPGCKTCTLSTSLCYSCSDGYLYNSATQTCTACTPPCFNCTGKTTTCTSCIADYALLGGITCSQVSIQPAPLNTSCSIPGCSICDSTTCQLCYAPGIYENNSCVNKSDSTNGSTVSNKGSSTVIIIVAAVLAVMIFGTIGIGFGIYKCYRVKKGNGFSPPNNKPNQIEIIADIKELKDYPKDPPAPIQYKVPDKDGISEEVKNVEEVQIQHQIAEEGTTNQPQGYHSSPLPKPKAPEIKSSKKPITLEDLILDNPIRLVSLRPVLAAQPTTFPFDSQPQLPAEQPS